MCRSREGGNPVVRKIKLGPRLRGGDVLRLPLDLLSQRDSRRERLLQAFLQRVVAGTLRVAE